MRRPGAPGRTGARRVVRLGVDAGRAVAPPVREQATSSTRFPADFICEAIDQTRGWFYSLLAVNTLVFGHSPYRNVVCLGLLLGQDGQKMSKSRGNVMDPWAVIERPGRRRAAVEHLLGRVAVGHARLREGIDDSTRRFLLTLWNTYSFFVTYARLDGWEPAREPEAVHVMDRWARSRLAGTVSEITDALEGFDVLRAAQALEGFVDDLRPSTGSPQGFNTGERRYPHSIHRTMHRPPLRSLQQRLALAVARLVRCRGGCPRRGCDLQSR